MSALKSAPHAPAAHAGHRPPNVFLRLLPITLTVFVGYLTVGLPLPVLPLHVHGTLGQTAFVVGSVAGCGFAAALLTRAWAGNVADRRGAKRAMLAGLMAGSLSGLVYLASLASTATPLVSVAVLTVGRVLVGAAESLLVTGGLSWGMGMVGSQNAGKVMAWVGIAMYVAYAVAAPAGMALYTQFGFAGISIAIAAIPLAGFAIILRVAPIAPPPAERVPFYRVLGKVWFSGLGLACTCTGFGTITTFISLLFASHGWSGASLVFTIFGISFLVARLLFSHLPDKLGGAKVALPCVVIEALGQALIWSAATPLLAYVGAALTGFGYSLAFPGFGVEAVKRAPPQSRGAAMGAYVAFMDIALGLGGPATGAIASHDGIAAVYLAGAITVSCGIVVALVLLAAAPRRVSTR